MIARAFLAVSSMLFAIPAMAQQNRNCAPRDIAVERLESVYGESVQSIGITAANQIVEMYGSTDTGTWTIIVSSPDGISCMVADGHGFQRIDNDPTPMGVPG
ncbi:MAG: hypothetical protein GW905_06670 [Rhodobacterales bacterium]|nr:hypothetical protein [Rhodobacterales bacterium]